MSHVIYLLRAPKCNGVAYKQIKLIELYLDWKHQCKKSSQHGSNTFESWCGNLIEELLEPEDIAFYKPFFERKHIETDDINGYRCCGIFEQMARFPQASQFLGWIMKNIIHTSSIPFEEVYEVSKETLEDWLETCNRTRRYGITCLGSAGALEMADEHQYAVNAAIAQTFLPILERESHPMSPFQYDTLYAEQIINAILALNDVLATTNFDHQTIYLHLSRTQGVPI